MRTPILVALSSFLGVAIGDSCFGDAPAKSGMFPPGAYVLAGGFTPAKGENKAEVKKPFPLQPGQYILSGGPSPTDRIVVDDDLELSVGSRKLFIDDDHFRSIETGDSCTYKGWPIILALPPKSRLRVRAIDCAPVDAVLGDLYLHRHDGAKVRLLKAREQRSAQNLPHVFVDEVFDPERVFPTAAAPRPAQALSAERLRILWDDLAGRDPATAYFALWELVSDPAKTVPFLAERVRPITPTDPRRLNQLLANLDANLFQVRQQATLDLKQMEKLAKPAIRLALEQRPSPEARLRMERMLARIQDAIYTPDTIRALRAIEVLEHIGTKEAQTALDQFAAGVPEARLTRDAKAAVQRLRNTAP
jgi:hypothetical protein